MARFSKRRSVTGISVLLALILISLCALISASDKYGLDLGFELPDVSLNPLSSLYGLIGELGEPENDGSTAEMRNALSVMENTDNLEVHFINVGQGKSILIRCGGKTALIDAGENSEGNAVAGYLRERGVKSIDYAIGTHPHSDHIGGMDVIIDSLEVKNIILPEIPEAIIPTTRAYTDLLLAIAQNGVSMIPATAGQTFALGYAELTVLGPVAEYDDLNNESVVTRLTYGETSFLFTGDIEEAAENGILDSGAKLESDVLDAAHHGSSSSSSENFIAAVSPKTTVVSCGIDNSYGHPHKEAMQRIMSICNDIYRTDLEGTVVILSDGRSLSVSTEK